MAPPELTRDAPGLDVFHPVEIRFLPILGDESGLAFAHRGDCRFRQFFRVDVPLVGQKRLDHHVRTVAVRDDVRLRLDFLDQAFFFEPGKDGLACGEAIHPLHRQRRVEVGRFRHAGDEVGIILQLKLGFGVEDIDQRQVMPFADLEIVEVVRRRDLDRARTLLRIGIVVGDDRNLPAYQRQNHALAYQFLVAIVVWMHRHRGVAEHRLRPRRCNDNERRAILRVECLPFDRIAQVPEVAFGLDLDHFKVGNCGQQLRIPVDQPLVLVDEARTVKFYKNFKNGT